MNPIPPSPSDDEALLRKLGYEPSLSRRMSGFANFAISLSIICIMAGGITSFHVGLGGAGGASIGLGWPLVCLFSLAVALAMGQIASAFPTAGGLYHWGCILGGRGCGWATAWFNLAGLVTVLGAINAGTFDFAASVFDFNPSSAVKMWVVVGMTLSQALLNHFGIRLTTWLTNLSGWLILVLAVFLTGALMIGTKHFDWSRLWTFTNFSGLPTEGPTYPKQASVAWLFALGFLLPAYTITGFDASAHTAEETHNAAWNVPRGIIRSVWVSSVFGWIMICAILLAIPDLREGVEQGANVVPWVMRKVLPPWVANGLLGCIIWVQYLCGLAALTSSSRMTFAFARDGGLPGSRWLSHVNPETRSPSAAVWAAATIAALFTIFVPYTTIAAIGTVFLYISYVIPIAAGCYALNRTWVRFGPWNLGSWYRPLSMLAILGCLFLIVIGVQPPNEQGMWIGAAALVLLLAVWFGLEQWRFKGPPTIYNEEE
ncbi:MAG TPA: amino acid permease [Candidatus Limnocylindria bacterium]|nr:amino acid permease [Candidatus Limnocylindria bacterium]